MKNKIVFISVLFVMLLIIACTPQDSKIMPSITLDVDKNTIYSTLNEEFTLILNFKDLDYNLTESPKKIAIYTELFEDYNTNYVRGNRTNFNDNFEIISLDDNWIKEEPSLENSGPSEHNFGDYNLHVNLLKENNNFVFIKKEIPNQDEVVLKLTFKPKSKGRFGLLFTGYNLNTIRHQLVSDGARICIADTIDEAKEICNKEIPICNKEIPEDSNTNLVNPECRAEVKH